MSDYKHSDLIKNGKEEIETTPSISNLENSELEIKTLWASENSNSTIKTLGVSAPDIKNPISADTPKSPSNNQNILLEKISKKVKWLFFGAVLLSLMIANFVLLGGFSIGFFITIIAAEALIFIMLPKPTSKKTLAFCIFLGICVAALAFAFFVFSDMVLSVINFFVIILLLLILLLSYSEAILFDWDHPKFFTELFTSPFIRPFKFLSLFPKVIKSFKRNQDISANSVVETNNKKTVKNSLIGIILAFPVLFVVIGLLSSADQVFGLYTQNVFDLFMKIKVSEYVYTLFFAAITFPFLFSFLYSYYAKFSETTSSNQLSLAKQVQFSIEPVVASTFILSLNIVYGLFSFVQFGSLFGAFQSVLPKNVTFAEYARQGFFQLSAVAFINILIVMVSVLLVKRVGISGVFVKIMSVLLVLFTFILLASALYRMKMYIDVYSLSKLRVLVSIFMVLIAFLLVYALIKEFWPKFRFVKFGFITAILVLIITNFLNINAFIARYNTMQFINNPKSEFNIVVSKTSTVSISVVDNNSSITSSSSNDENNVSDSRSNNSNSNSNSDNSDINSGNYSENSDYERDNAGSFSGDNTKTEDGSTYSSRIYDFDYIIYELSYDAIPEILVLVDSKDPEFAKSVSTSLENIYKFQLKDYCKDNWKEYNLSKERAKRAIEEKLGDKLGLNK